MKLKSFGQQQDIQSNMRMRVRRRRRRRGGKVVAQVVR